MTTTTGRRAPAGKHQDDADLVVQRRDREPGASVARHHDEDDLDGRLQHHAGELSSSGGFALAALLGLALVARRRR